MARQMGTVELSAEVIVSSALLYRCIIQDRCIDFQPLHVQPGTTARRSGDKGIVVIPTWLAAAMGLVA